MRAGIEGDVVYLLICDNGRLFAVDERGNEIFTADIDPDTLGSDERELLSRGLSLSGDAALREAIEDLSASAQNNVFPPRLRAKL